MFHPEIGGDARLRFESAVLSHVSDAVIVVDRDGRVVYWNAAATALYGVDADEVVGQPLTHAFNYEWIRPEDEAAARGALERDRRWRGEVIHRLRSGQRRYVEATVRRFDDDELLPAGAAAVMRDVTARREMEQHIEEARDALDLARRRLGLALRAARAGAWDWEVARGVVHWSAEYYDLFGLDPSVPATVENWLESIHPDDRAAVTGEVARTFAARERELRLEYRVASRDGSVRWLAGIGVNSYDAAGGPLRTTGIAIDISDRKALELERERLLASERDARAAADAALHARDVLIATMSHELRNPVNAVLGWTQILRTLVTAGGDGVERALDAIEHGARAESTLIEELMDLSRATAGKLHVEKRRVDLAGCIRRALDFAHPAAQEKRIALVDRVGAPLLVDGDDARLQQVVGNLLSNAIKFTDSGGRVEVAAGRDGTQALLTVTDTGSGIRREFLERLFEPFSQAAEPAGRHEGLGLGLAITRSLVELHGGTIAAESDGPGRGSTFLVRIPLAAY